MQQLSMIFQVGIEIAIIAGKNTIYTTINKLHTVNILCNDLYFYIEVHLLYIFIQ